MSRSAGQNKVGKKKKEIILPWNKQVGLLSVLGKRRTISWSTLEEISLEHS